MAQSPTSNSTKNKGKVIQLGSSRSEPEPSQMPVTFEDIFQAANSIAVIENEAIENKQTSSKPATRVSSLDSLKAKKSPFKIRKADDEVETESAKAAVVPIGKPPSQNS